MWDPEGQVRGLSFPVGGPSLGCGVSAYRNNFLNSSGVSPASAALPLDTPGSIKRTTRGAECSSFQSTKDNQRNVIGQFNCAAMFVEGAQYRLTHRFRSL